MTKRTLRVLITVHAALALLSGAPAHAADAPKVLRYAFPTAETGFDPAQLSDLYSLTVTPHIFEGLYHYDLLARPFKIKPRTAVAMPEVSADFTEWTVSIRPGIHFADDPAFNGRRRELVAADYVYSFKRFFDPALKSPAYSSLRDEGVIGLDALRREALSSGRPFDYDREVDGVRALDRYTIRFKLAAPRPRFLYTLASGESFGAVAREVVERYGDKIMEHPVGTGPFLLKQWRRSSLIVLERNPNYREHVYDAEPSADDAAGQSIAARFKGRRLPMIDRVEISIIDESQPRWLSFLDRRYDLLQGVPLEFAEIAAPNGRLAPNLERQGITMQRQANPDVTMAVYNMEDGVVGGYTPERVALRRAINLAYDVEREIRIVRRGQAVPAEAGIPPGTYGYDPRYRSENSLHDLARAKALLDIHGYVDRDGDGWRERPDGRPLVVEMSSPPDQVYRQLNEVRKKSMDALGVKLVLRIGAWAEQLKAARAGKFQMWQVGSSAGSPDGQPALERSYGPAKGGANLARFELAAFDSIYERMIGMPDGPERQALFTQANNLLVAWAPYKFNVHRIVTDLAQPWLVGYRRPTFSQEFWHYVDIDTSTQPAR